MAISFVAATDTSDSGSGTCNKPAGIASGDFLVATVGVYDTSTAVTAPSGWTLKNTANDGNSRSLIYTKTAGSSEPSSYTWSGPSYFDIAISAFHSSTAATLQLDGSVSSNNNSSQQAPSVTATNASEMLYVSWVSDQNSGTTNTISASNSVTRDTGVTGASSGADGFVAGHKLLSSSGSTGATTFSASGWAPVGMGTSLLIEEASGSTVSGGGTLQGNGVLLTPTPLSGSGVLSASAQIVAPASLQGNGQIRTPTPLSGQGVLTETGALLIAQGQALPGDGVLAEETAILVAHGDTLQGNGLIASSVIQGGGALGGNGALAGAAQIITAGTLSGDGLLSAPAQIITPATPLAGDGLLTQGAAILLAASAPLPGDGLLTQASALITAHTLTLIGEGILSGTGHIPLAAGYRSPVGATVHRTGLVAETNVRQAPTASTASHSAMPIGSTVKE